MMALNCEWMKAQYTSETMLAEPEIKIVGTGPIRSVKVPHRGEEASPTTAPRARSRVANPTEKW